MQNHNLPSSEVTLFSKSSSQPERHCTGLVYVAKCDLGWGVFAARDIPERTPILTLTGPIISTAEALAKGARMGDPLQVGIDQYIDLEPPGVFLNHSCEPNTVIVNDNILTSLRAIQPHEELRFDYSTTMSHDGWTMDCLCGAPHCRGVARDFEFLPAALQRRYIEQGIVQSFISRHQTAPMTVQRTDLHDPRN